MWKEDGRRERGRTECRKERGGIGKEGEQRKKGRRGEGGNERGKKR